MSITIFDKEPISFVAGDTVKWKKSVSGFPASEGWTLSYALVKDGVQITFNASADGDDYAVTISAEISAGYTPGVYAYQAKVSYGTEAATVATGRIEIKPTFAAQSSGYDARSFAKKMVDALETLFPVLAAKGFASYSIAGRSGTYHSKAELREDYKYWKSVYIQEERNAGRKRSRIIKMRLR